MPEVSEVKLTTEYLEKTLSGKIITDWKFLSGKYHDAEPSGFNSFYNELPSMVSEIKCKGKLIYMHCFNEFHEFYILHNMHMTGSWREKPDESSRWFVEINSKQKLWFRDPRCFGTLMFTENEDIFKSIFNKLGPDIMSDEFNLQLWRKIIAQHKDKNVTSFLMDQSIISGCGNYIKSEVLYYAKILPSRKIDSLTENESEKLFEALRIIPRIAYLNKGLSLRDYTDPKGKKGFHEFQLQIYGQKNAKRQKTMDGRTTYFDPNIQV